MGDTEAPQTHPPTHRTEHPTTWALGGPGKCWKQRGRRAGRRGALLGRAWAVELGEKGEVLTSVIAVTAHNWLSCPHGATGTSSPPPGARHSNDPVCQGGTLVPRDRSAQDLVKVIPPADAGTRTQPRSSHSKAKAISMAQQVLCLFE